MPGRLAGYTIITMHYSAFLREINQISLLIDEEKLDEAQERLKKIIESAEDGAFW